MGVKVNEICTQHATEIREYMESEGLTQKWLRLRLARDNGVKLSESRLAILLSGKEKDYKGCPTMGRMGKIYIFLALQIINKYKTVFEKKENNNGNTDNNTKK